MVGVWWVWELTSVMLQCCWTVNIVSGHFNDFSSIQITFLTMLGLQQKFLERNIQEHSVNTRIRWKAVRTRSFCLFETKSHAVQANLELTKWLMMIRNSWFSHFHLPRLKPLCLLFCLVLLQFLHVSLEPIILLPHLPECWVTNVFHYTWWDQRLSRVKQNPP